MMTDKLFDSNEMVKVGCNDCQGCFDCCREMGESIILDPYDVYLLEVNLHCGFEELLRKQVELQVVDGLILPNLKMLGADERCGFLNESGRCGIHEFRPGLCRLFPLGRNYADGELKYFVLEDVCPKQNQAKVKIKKWLDVPDLKRYEKFLVEWHYFRKQMQEEIKKTAKPGIQRMNMKLLGIFYITPYEAGDFYAQFEQRMEQWKSEYEGMQGGTE